MPKSYRHHERDKSNDEEWSSKRRKKKAKGKKAICRISDKLEDDKSTNSFNLDDIKSESEEQNEKGARVCLILNNLELFQIRE